MTRLRLITLVGCLVALAGTSVHAAPGHGNEQSEVAAIEQVTESIRHLHHLRPVRAVFPDDRSFTNALAENLRKGNPDREIALGQRESVLVGFLRANQSLKKILYGALEGQVLGFYDMYSKSLYVRNQGNRVFGPGRWAIAHEYNHALQDQHYGLIKLLPDQGSLSYRNSDAVAAHHALTEGDSVAVQTLFIDKTYSKADLKALNDQQAHLKLPSLPKAIQRQFDFPYTTGADFVGALYLKGGMAAVDAAYRRLPASTYEIMYPTAYASGWKSADIRLHRVAGFEGWKQVDDDVFGAFGYEVLLWQDLPRSQADSVVRQYRGDRYLFFEKGPVNAMLMKSRWSDHRAALAAEAALLHALRIRFPSAHVSGSAHEVVRERTGAVCFGVVGTTVTVAYAPEAREALRLGTARTS